MFICTCDPICTNIYVHIVCVCSGLLNAGDRILEVNGFVVDGMEPEQVIQTVVSLII